MTIRSAIALTAALFSITPIHAFDEIKDCDVCPELVVAPAGEFMMGSPDKESTLPDEKPAHLVKIAKAFAVGKPVGQKSETPSDEANGVRHDL